MTPEQEIENCPEYELTRASEEWLCPLVSSLPKKRTIYPSSEAEFYGASHVIANRIEASVPPPTKARWTHGWNYYIESDGFDIAAIEQLLRWSGENDWIHLCRTRVEERAFHEIGISNAVAVGLPYSYVLPLNLKRLPKSVLAMPPHSTWKIRNSVDQDRFLRLLKERYSGYNVTVCLTPSCYQSDRWSIACQKFGMSWIRGAHPYDANSLFRMRALFESFERIVSCNLGSHVVYATVAGASVEILELPVEKRFIGQRESFYEGLHTPANEAAVERKKTEILALSRSGSTCLMDWGKECIGYQYLRKPIEIARLLGWSYQDLFARDSDFEPRKAFALGWRSPREASDRDLEPPYPSPRRDKPNKRVRLLPMIKVHQKFGGCLRTIKGAEQFLRIRSYVGALRKSDKWSLGGLLPAIATKLRSSGQRRGNSTE